MPSAICARLYPSRLSRIAVQLPVESRQPLRGWLGLREKLIHSQDQSVRYTAGNETFLFRF
jgi:hypothetical protein